MVMPSSLAAAACGRNGSRAADRQRPTQDRPDCSGNRWLPQTMCTGFKYQGRNLSCHPPNGVCVVLPSPNGVCVVLQSPNFLDGAHFSWTTDAARSAAVGFALFTGPGSSKRQSSEHDTHHSKNWPPMAVMGHFQTEFSGVSARTCAPTFRKNDPNRVHRGASPLCAPANCSAPIRDAAIEDGRNGRSKSGGICNANGAMAEASRSPP